MTNKSNFVSAFAALVLSTLFVGSAVVPATAIASAPVAVSQNA